MNTFLFYDIETTGLNKAFDQVLHFAGIRTDQDLQELERYEIKVKLNKDVIPSPYAMITHQMSLNDIQNGQSEFEAIQQIHQWLNHPGTISLGYNTLGFDDEFLRFSFYRNLLSPYTHQYANSCGRMDLYPMTVMYFLFKKDTLKWPLVNGMTSLKLEQLNALNQLADGSSHDAMDDVRATLALARAFFKEYEMWNYLAGYFNKQTEESRLKDLTFALLIDGALGASLNYQCPVLYLGNHKHYKYQVWLRLDSTELPKTTAQTFTETTWVMTKKLGEPNFILPMKTRFLKQLDPKRFKLAKTNEQWLNEHPDLLKAIKDYYLEYKYPLYPADSEACLYLNGFWTKEEENFCREFHRAPPEHKAKLTKKITNQTLQTLALRILARHYPDSLSLDEINQYNQYMMKVTAKAEEEALLDHQGKKRLTPNDAKLELDELVKNPDLSAKQLALLADFKNYLQENFEINNLL